jgi:hypothetical protein
MPLARIFTHHPERTTSLSQELQQQGYQVEVRSPDQTHLAPADLEIEFEICDRADALERAAVLADEFHADVAVAPGVVLPSAAVEAEPRPIVPVEPEPSPMVNVPVEVSGHEPERDREREFEAAFIAQAETPPMVENSPLPPVAFAEEPSTMRAEPVIVPIHESAEEAGPAAREESPMPYLAQLTPFSASEAQAEESQHRNSEPKHAEGPGIGQSVASIFSTALAGAKTMSASAAESFRERFQEYKKRAQVRSAEARAARVARMLDLEQRKTEAQQRAAELESAREAASARLLELVRDRQPGLSEEDRKITAARTPVSSLRHASIAGMRTKPRRPLSPQLRAVLTGAAAISVLFVIGIVLGELSPRTPAAGPSSHASSNSGVTVQTGNTPAQSGGGTLQSSAPAAQPAVAPKPQAGSAQTPAQQKPSPRVGTARRVAAAQGEQEVGDDVVIRHYSRPAPTEKPKQSGQQAGLKHFSDMN